MRSRMGSRNAAVLPLPVTAEAHTSRPAMARGMTEDCMGVGVTYPMAAMERRRGRLRFIWLNMVCCVEELLRFLSSWMDDSKNLEAFSASTLAASASLSTGGALFSSSLSSLSSSSSLSDDAVLFSSASTSSTSLGFPRFDFFFFCLPSRSRNKSLSIRVALSASSTFSKSSSLSLSLSSLSLPLLLSLSFSLPLFSFSLLPLFSSPSLPLFSSLSLPLFSFSFSFLTSISASPFLSSKSSFRCLIRLLRCAAIRLATGVRGTDLSLSFCCSNDNADV
mmetsp:Transcript_54895/g.66115  ORF Transcript_54895/g.66115 Transcript_54895/m.66115 type:complete len:278 (-) Transcript_54895:304-1137(-)